MTKDLRFLIKHSSIYGIGTVVAQAVGFLLLPFYTRYLTPADYGVMSLINVTIDIVGLILTLNIVNAMSRYYFDYAEIQDQNRVISTVYWIFFVMAGAFLPILYLSATPLSILVFGSSVYEQHFLVALLSLIVGANVDLGLTYLRIKSESTKFVKISILRTVCLIGLNIYFIAGLKTGVLGIFYATLICGAVFAIGLSTTTLFRVNIRFSLSLAKDMIMFSFPLIFSNVFRIVVNQSDKYLINYFFTPFQTGIYSVAQKIGQSIHSLITSPFLQSYLPKRFDIMRQSNAKAVYAMVLKYYVLFIGTVGLVLSVFSPEIIRLMTTEEYFATATYIPFVVSSMIIFGMKYHFETGIIIEKQTKYIAIINGISAVVNIFLNYFLIQKYNLWGALIASNVSMVVTTGLHYVFSQRLYPVDFKLGEVYKIILCLVGIYGLCCLVNSQSIFINIILKLLLISAYGVLVICLGIIDTEIVGTYQRRIGKMFGLLDAKKVG